MPKWGLEDEQIGAKPWNLPPKLLRPCKTITDPVHGDIYLNELEREITDSPPFQRLRRIRQLGTAHLVYPGATHSRFSHALGTLRAAQDLIDAAIAHSQGPYPVADYFAAVPADRRNLQIGEATVLARLGALLHDLGHVPFGHTVEDDLGLLIPHDKNEKRFARFWGELPETVRAAISPELFEELKRLILSKVDEEFEGRYPFVADIVGNTICADLIDYVKRDHHNTGLPLQIGHRFLDGFFVTPPTRATYASRMAVQIARDGRERADVVTELLKVIRYRYEDDERILVHHAKLAADAMLGKMLDMWHDVLWVDQALAAYPTLAVTRSSDIDAVKQAVADENPAMPKEIDRLVQNRIEDDFCRFGDDGILERMMDLASAADTRSQAVARLAAGVLHRELYKRAGRTNDAARANAAKLHEKYRGADVRRKLEQDAARFAGLDHRTHVVVWVPAPTMRKKTAKVLVDDGHTISTLDDHLKNAGRRNAEDIYQDHAHLWAISVYVHPSVSPEQRAVVLAWISRELDGIGWEVGERQSLFRLAVQQVARNTDLRHSESSALGAVEPRLINDMLARSHTFAEFVNMVDGLRRTGAEDVPEIGSAKLDEAVAVALSEWRKLQAEMDLTSFEHPQLEMVLADATGTRDAVGDAFALAQAPTQVGSVNLRLLLRDLLRQHPESPLRRIATECQDLVLDDPYRVYSQMKTIAATVPKGRRKGSQAELLGIPTVFELALTELLSP